MTTVNAPAFFNNEDISCTMPTAGYPRYFLHHIICALSGLLYRGSLKRQNLTVCDVDVMQIYEDRCSSFEVLILCRYTRIDAASFEVLMRWVTHFSLACRVRLGAENIKTTLIKPGRVYCCKWRRLEQQC